MRNRLECGVVFWLQINYELKLWIKWFDKYDVDGLDIPADIERGLAGAEDAWSQVQEYVDWASKELRKANQQLEEYILACHQLGVAYGVDMVRLIYLQQIMLLTLELDIGTLIP